MRTQLTNLWILLFAGLPLTGCQSGRNQQQATEAHASVSVLQSFGTVDVLKGENKLFPTRNEAMVAKIRQVGYESRNVGGVVKLRHQSGRTAEVTYFTEVTNDTIGIGRLKYRKSGDTRAIISIDGKVIGECSFRKSAIELATLTYGEPHARKDGEEVVVGKVVVGPVNLTVVSRCEEIGDQGAAAKFFAGQDLKVWHEYRRDNRTVALRVLKPEATVEFLHNLSPTEQLCIVADMNYRLAKERLDETRANTIYVPVSGAN